MARSRARAGGRGSGHKTVVMLSLAVPGLGHHRLDELERGLVFLAAAFVAFGASALAPATFAVTLFVSGAAVYDAHRGARSADAGGAPRPATAGLLLLPAAATLALLVALAP